MANNSSNLSNNNLNFEALIDQLPKGKHWEILDLYNWRGHWLNSDILKASLALPTWFEPRDDDVVLASSIKVGTTWLKSLCSSIMMQSPSEALDDHDALSKSTPHVLVPTIESMTFANDPIGTISNMPSPRLLHTHLPYNILSDSIKKSNCKIIYITRNPKDTFVSMWHHMNDYIGAITNHPLPLEKAFDSFCDGCYVHGPFFEHVVGYYKESLNETNKLLFLKYEDLQNDPKEEVIKLAAFLGRPFGSEEEADRVIWQCSLDRLKNLEVNKNGTNPYNGLPNNIFFRRGITGDSRNYLTKEMEERLDEITRTKFEGTGLYFNA